METVTFVQNLSPADFGPADRYHRRHRMTPPKTVSEKLGTWFQNAFEAALCRASALKDVAIYDTADFPWAAAVEGEWRKIRAELDQVMLRREEIPAFHEILKEVETITTDNNWKTFFLKGVAMDCAENASRCPETMRIISQIPGLTTAFFSILSPHKHIRDHRGPYAGVLRLHLGLIVPEPRERCRIRISNQLYSWSEGKCLIFDDTYNHEVWNDANGHRVVLFIDFARPLRWPFNWINNWLINLAPLAPFLREAQGKHKAWEKKFYKK